MKHMHRRLALILTLLLIFASIPATAHAAALKEASFKLINKTDTTVQVSITKVDGAAGYGIYQKVDGTWKRIASTTNTKYTVKNLKPAHKYTFTVRAYRVVDGVKKYSTNYNRTGKTITTWAAGRVADPVEGTYLLKTEDEEYALSVTTDGDVFEFEIYYPWGGGKLAYGYCHMKRGEAWQGSYTFYFYRDKIKVVETGTAGLSGYYKLQQ